VDKSMVIGEIRLLKKTKMQVHGLPT